MSPTKKSARALKELPDDYECIAPDESELVFAYVRGHKEIDERLVTLHVHLCALCHETIKNMKDIDEAMRHALVEV